MPPKPSLFGLARKCLAFPTIVTPQGVALVILFAAAYPTLRGELALAVVEIMVINVLAMFFVRRILGTPGVMPALVVLGSVVGVLQVALGIQFIFNILRDSGLLG
jgi:multiple antibiotic resistance protein